MFRNKQLQKELEEEGFVKIKFLTSHQINDLRQLYQKYEEKHRSNSQLHYSTFHLGDEEMAKDVDREIRATIDGNIANYFEDYKFFVANFMIKETGKSSEIEPHQDLTFVDEDKYESLSIWAPLQDVDENNGCLTFLPKSHKIKNPTLRVSPVFPKLFNNTMKLAKKNMISLPLKLGEAVVFYHSVLHGSTANQTNTKRLNIVQGLYSKDGQLHLNFINNNETIIERYNITVEDFYRIKTLQSPPPFLTVEKKFTFDFPQLSQKEFLAYYRRPFHKRAITLLKNTINHIFSGYKHHSF